MIAFQAVVAIQNFLMGGAWADKLLDRSWNTAMVDDPELIHDLQAEVTVKQTMGCNTNLVKHSKKPLADNHRSTT